MTVLSKFTQEDFDRLISERAEMYGEAPRKMLFHELDKVHELLNKALVQIRDVNQGCFDFDAYINDIVRYGLKLTIIEKDEINWAFCHLKTERSNPQWDWPKIEGSEKEIELARKITAENHYKETLGKVIYSRERCLDFLEGRRGDLAEFAAYMFDLGHIAAGNQSIALERETFGLDEDASPHKVLGAMEKAALSRIKGKEASGRRSASKNEIYQRALELVDQLWMQDEHRAKKHHQMAKLILEFSPDGTKKPFEKLSKNGLNDRLKQHLRITGRAEKIFNGSQK